MQIQNGKERKKRFLFLPAFFTFSESRCCPLETKPDAQFGEKTGWGILGLLCIIKTNHSANKQLDTHELWTSYLK